MAHSPCFNLPLLVSPLYHLLLTWNPPSCDRNRPPQSQVACKLTPLVPHLAPVPSPPKFHPSWVFPDPMCIQLERHCEPNSHAHAHYCRLRFPKPNFSLQNRTWGTWGKFALRDSQTRFCSLPKSLNRYLKAFRIWLKIQGDISDFFLTPAFVDTPHIV